MRAPSPRRNSRSSRAKPSRERSPAIGSLRRLSSCRPCYTFLLTAAASFSNASTVAAMAGKAVALGRVASS